MYLSILHEPGIALSELLNLLLVICHQLPGKATLYNNSKLLKALQDRMENPWYLRPHTLQLAEKPG